MSSTVRTLPTRLEPLGRVPVAGSAAERQTTLQARVAACSLAVLVACSALIIVMASDRPSFMAATSHTHFFPGWMAGPLGGVWPTLTRDNTTLKYMFTGCVMAMYLSYVLAIKYVERLSLKPVVLTVLAVHAIMLLAPPLSLTDIFNYINYGRMEVFHHLNPYATIPVLEPHSDPSYSLSNWHHLLSPYGPLFTIISFAIVPFGVAASFWLFKGLLVLASLATIALVYRCARLLGRPPAQAVVFVGLNPIVTVWGLGGDHNDFIMVFLIVLGFYLLLRARQPTVSQPPAHSNGHTTRSSSSRRWWLALSPFALAAGGVLTLAVFVKASAAILMPIVLAAVRKSPRTLVSVVLGMALAAVLAGIASLVAFGPHLPDLSTQSKVVTSVSLPNLLGLALGQGGETNTMRAVLFVGLALTVLACTYLAWRRREWLDGVGWATVALLVTLSWVLPWYVLWLLPMAALSSSRRLRTVTLAIGVYLVLAWVPVSAGVLQGIGFEPSKTSLGKEHQRLVKELLN
jgi:hypothetical protein